MNNSDLSLSSGQGPLPIHWVENVSDKGKMTKKMQFLDENTKKHHLIAVKNFVKNFSNVPPVSTSKKDIWIQVQDEDQQIGWANVKKKSVEDVLQATSKEEHLDVAKNDGVKVKHKVRDRGKGSSKETGKSLRLLVLSLIASSASGLVNAHGDLQAWPNNLCLNPIKPAHSSFSGFLVLDYNVPATELSELGLVTPYDPDFPDFLDFSSLDVCPPSTQPPPHVIKAEKFIAAIESSDKALVTKMIKAGIDVNKVGLGNLLPLDIAINNGNKGMISLLHELGASLIQPENHEFFLNIAVRSGHVASIKALLELGISIDQRNDEGYTALHIASSRGNIKTVIELIRLGANIEAKDQENGRTPLILATSIGNLEVIKELIRLGANIEVRDDFGRTPLILATSIGNIKAIKELIRLGANIEAKDQESGHTPLILATNIGNLEAIKELIRLGANIEAKDQENGRTSLILATNIGNIEAIKELIRLGANIESRDDYGRTPLILATSIGNIKAIKEIIRLGANLEAKDQENGRTPLILATSIGNIKAIKELIRLGANIEAKDQKNGRTPLILATIKGDLKAVKELISLGANLNAQDLYLRTSLHLASFLFHRDLINILINAGASTKIISSNGDTPLITCLTSHPNEDCITVIGMNAISKFQLAIKELSHSWEIKGVTKIGTHTIELEGGFPQVFAPYFQTQINAFAEKYTNLITQTEALKLNDILSRSNSDFFLKVTELGRKKKISEEIYYNKLPTLFHTNFKIKDVLHGDFSHSVEIVIHGNKLVICNKGYLSRKPIEVFNISDKGFPEMENLVDGILKLRDSTEDAYKNWLDEITQISL